LLSSLQNNHRSSSAYPRHWTLLFFLLYHHHHHNSTTLFFILSSLYQRRGQTSIWLITHSSTIPHAHIPPHPHLPPSRVIPRSPSLSVPDKAAAATYIPYPIYSLTLRFPFQTIRHSISYHCISKCQIVSVSSSPRSPHARTSVCIIIVISCTISTLTLLWTPLFSLSLSFTFSLSVCPLYNFLLGGKKDNQRGLLIRNVSFRDSDLLGTVSLYIVAILS